MKSYNTSFPRFRRALAAAAVLAAAEATAAAQPTGSGQSTSPQSSPTGSYNRPNPSNTSGAPAASMNDTDMSGTRGSSSSMSGGMSGTGSENASASSTSNKKLSWGDRRFVTRAADDGQAEVQLAQLAAQKASNPDVRNYAQQLVDQHTQVNSELMDIASSRNLKIDQDQGHDRAYRRLSKTSGDEFDREFVDHMIDEHEKDIRMFEKASRDAKDPEVKQFASKTLASLRQDLTQAQQLQRSIVPTGRTESDTPQSPSSGSSSDMSTSGSSGSGMNSGADSSTSTSTTDSMR